MYGQGNYAPQFGQGSQTSLPQFQQCPASPLPPPFQQNPPASQPSTIQQGPPSIPPHVVHSGPPLYQHAPPPPVQQGLPVQVPTSGMLNAGRSYLLPPPSQQVHGSTSMVHSYPIIQQNSQWTHNMHHIAPLVPPPLGSPPIGPSRAEMFQSSLPSRVLPTLPLQGQTPYRGPIHLPQQGSVQGTQRMPLPPPPPPPSCSFFTPAPFEISVHSAHQDSNVPATGPMPSPPPPPPPPSSPPPLPPSPPLPTSPLTSFETLSSTPLRTASDLSHYSESGPISNYSAFEVIASDSIDKVVVSTHISDDAPVFDEDKNPEGTRSCDVGFPVKEDLPYMEGTKLGLPPPPPKPVEEKVVRKIEVLCHFIAKNGPGFEDMAHQKESRNPEFEFLFGGEPGSEAAVAHEYFEWMKRKCISPCKLQHKHINSVLRPSTQTNFLFDAGVSHSSSDSDMDMEDDITQPDEEQRVYTSFEGLNRDTGLIPQELDIREQLLAPQSAVEYCLVKDTVSRSSGLAGREKGSKPFLDRDHFAYGRSLSKVDSSVTNLAGAAECPSNSNVVKSSVPPLDDLSQSNASAAAAGIGSEKFLGELIKGASPFRLLQEYASDDSPEDVDKPCLEDVSPVTASPSTTLGATSLHADIGSNLHADAGSKSLSSSEMALGKFSESIVAFSQSLPLNALEFSPESQRTARETNITSIATVKTEEIVGNNNGNQGSFDNAASSEVLQRRDDLDGVRDAVTESSKSQSQKEDVRYTSTLPKVDEFGRLLREGASDSDSDESCYTGRHGMRGASRSQSRSPHDRRRRRRRRSPQRRKEKRSRSRSWSPKKRRSRSRSPTYRLRGESGGDKMRRDKGQLPECLDFLRDRCHRGAFCRYRHHDSDKSDGVRCYRNKQQCVEVPTVSMTSVYREEIEETPAKRSVHKQDTRGSSFGALKDEKMDGEKVLVSLQDAVQSIVSDQDDKSLVAEVAKSGRSREVTAIVQETRDIKVEILESTTCLPDNENCLKRVEAGQPVDGSPSCPLTDVAGPMPPGDTSHGRASSVENWVIPHSQADLSVPVLQHADHQPQHAAGSSTSDSSLVQTSKTLQNQLPVSEPHINKISSVHSYPGTGSISQSFSSQSLRPKNLTPPVIPAVDFPDHHSQLRPPLPSLSQGGSTPPAPQLPREHDLMHPTSKFSSLSPPMENCSPPQGPLENQHSHFAVPPNSSWSLRPLLPLPPWPPFVNNSTVNAATAMQGVPLLQFQQNQLPTRNDFTSQTFVRPNLPELPAHSQVGEFQHHSYPLLQEQEPPRPSSYIEDFRPKTLLMSNPMSQPFGVTGLVREDQVSQFPVQGLNAPNLFAKGNITPQPAPSPRDSAARRMQSFLSDNLPSGGFFTSSSQNHPYSLQQPPLYGLQQPAADGLSVNLLDYGNINSAMSRYTSDLLDKNQQSHLSDFGGSRIANHYNPYASTFDQPLSSKLSSNVFKKEKDMPCSNLYDASYSLRHVQVDGHGVGSLGSRCMTSSPKSARAADLPRSGSDQYDPLCDSIEPSSNSSKKFYHGQKHEPAEDSVMVRLSGSCKPLDVEENNKQKDVEVVTINTSVKSENDEYGETADAEVGDLENESASNQLDAANTALGEIEIDQVEMPGKSKKSKDSRSMKLFKVALADFVKEVLKPLWRQGTMSKEAFKTIVKKTVEKVSGAMKSHQIPKSQEKINQYVDSSQRKLTKLVMGYVQKYEYRR